MIASSLREKNKRGLIGGIIAHLTHLYTVLHTLTVVKGMLDEQQPPWTHQQSKTSSKVLLQQFDPKTTHGNFFILIPSFLGYGIFSRQQDRKKKSFIHGAGGGERISDLR